jgi:hypothetical protein
MVDELNAFLVATLPAVDASGASQCELYEADDKIMTDLPENQQLRRGIAVSVDDDRRPPGIPPKELELRVGTVVYVIRNLNIREGLVNGAKAVVHSLNRFSVVIELLRDGSVHLIPRINFGFSISGLDINRKQLPLRVAYAGTLHKAQGKTLDRALLALTHDCFAHGQLYVGMTRVKCAADIAVLLPAPTDDGVGTAAGSSAAARGVINVVSRSLVAGLCHTTVSGAADSPADIPYLSAPRLPSAESAAARSLPGQRLPADPDAVYESVGWDDAPPVQLPSDPADDEEASKDAAQQTLQQLISLPWSDALQQCAPLRRFLDGKVTAVWEEKWRRGAG